MKKRHCLIAMSFFTNLQYLIRPFIHTYIFFYILNTKYKIYRKEIYLIMKKSILFIPVLISLSIVGCTMNYNQPSSDKVIHQSSLNIDKLINANAADVEKSLGSPYYATYYIDADKLKSKNINSISIEDLKEDVSLLASYNDNQSSDSYLHPYYATYYIDADKLKSKNINSISIEDLKEDVSLLASYNDNQSSDSYLHIYYEDGVVKDALYGPYKIDNLDNVISASNISNADYKVSFFKNRGAICLYYEDGVVKDALYGPYKIDNLDNVISASNISNADYKVSFFKNRGAICYNDFSIDNAKKEFVGKPISNFNNTYKLKSANFVASTINESDTLYFYPLVNHDVIHKDQYKHPNYSSNENAKLGLVNPLNNNISSTNKTNGNDLANYYKSAVVLYTKDDKIQSIQIADKQFFYKLINDVFNK